MPFDERSMYGYDEPSSQERTSSPDRDREDKDHEEGKTAMLNQDIAPGKQPGDMITLRVVEVHESEYSVELDEEGEHEKGGAREGEEAPMPGGGDHGMASMME